MLSGLQRIGVVLSLLWLVAAPLSIRMKQLDFAKEHLSRTTNNCVSPVSDCIAEAYRTYAELIVFDKSTIIDCLFFAVAPVLLGWVISYLVLKTFLWVKAGFNRNA